MPLYISQTNSHYHHQEFSTCSTIKKKTRDRMKLLCVCVYLDWMNEVSVSEATE